MMTETSYDLMLRPRACPAFEWVGQALISCDECGKPWWDHSHEARNSPTYGVFAGRTLRVIIPRAKAVATRRKWTGK